MIRSMTARNHSYRHVRYPDTALAGKVVVITGGGTGMGRSLALEAARRGGNVVITGRRPAPLLETKADMDDLLRHLGLTNRTLCVQGDVSDPKYVGEMFEQIEKEFAASTFCTTMPASRARWCSARRTRRAISTSTGRRSTSTSPDRGWRRSRRPGSWRDSRAAGRSSWWGRSTARASTTTSCTPTRGVCRTPPRSPPSSRSGITSRGRSRGKRSPSSPSTRRRSPRNGLSGGAASSTKGRRRAPASGAPSPRKRWKKGQSTLERTVGHAFVDPRDFAALALEVVEGPFRRTIGGVRLPMGGVTYEQPPGVFPSPAALSRIPTWSARWRWWWSETPSLGDVPLIESSAAAIARAGAAVILSGGRPEDPRAGRPEDQRARVGEGTATVSPVNLSHPAQVQELFDSLPRIDLLLDFYRSVDWKRPLTNLPHDEWTARVDRFGLDPRFLCWQAERRMDRDGTDGTIILVGPDSSRAPRRSGSGTSSRSSRRCCGPRRRPRPWNAL